MPQPIAFVTGNSGKYATAREHLAALGVEIEQVALDLDEIQSTSTVDVARHKAQQAYQTLGRPLFVEDSGFGIDELGGWPGPMVKHLLTAVGAAGLAHLGDLTQTRSCRFASALVHVDGNGVHRAFLDDGQPGTLANVPEGHGNAESWSPLWEVFIAAGTSAPLAALDEREREHVFGRWRATSVFARFGRWQTQKGSAPPPPGTS
jgi:XTP/dITP diphosphohydrolase